MGLTRADLNPHRKQVAGYRLHPAASNPYASACIPKGDPPPQFHLTFLREARGTRSETWGIKRVPPGKQA